MPRDPEASPYLFVVAAESSGDRHAGAVVRALRGILPGVECGAFGGPELEAAGCELHADLTGSATMVLGFLGDLGGYLRLLARFDRLLAARRPAAVVLVDSPGLNFLFARLARWRGVPVVYYICPQVWAWGAWRRGKVLRWTDLLLPILPFEAPFWEGHGVPVRWPGHPLADSLAACPADLGAALRGELGVAPGETLIGLFPGSRRQEVEGLADAFCGLVRRVGPAAGEARLAVSCHQDAFRPAIDRALARHGLDAAVLGGDARRLMAACDLAVVASGTASLELAWFATPMLVLYRTSRVGRWFFEAFRVTPWIALPNILGMPYTDGPTVHEELFCDAPSDAAVDEARRLLVDPAARHEAVARLERLRAGPLCPGGVEGAAREIAAFLRGRGGADVPSEEAATR